MNDDGIIAIFCDVDNPCNELEVYCKGRLLPSEEGKEVGNDLNLLIKTAPWKRTKS